MVFLRRKAHFNAAHRLHNPQKTDEWNEKVFGVCNSKNWHGHNFKVEAVVAGSPDEDTGFIINLKVLASIIDEYIVQKCDHKNLNLDVDFLENIMPTTENLAKVFYEQLEEPVNEKAGEAGFLYAVNLQETERNSAEYCPHKQVKR